jgi:hypothetical protein
LPFKFSGVFGHAKKCAEKYSYIGLKKKNGSNPEKGGWYMV